MAVETNRLTEESYTNGAVNPQLEIKKLIQKDFAKLQSQNPSFSLRSHAKKLNVVPSALSEIMCGKRNITAKMAKRILQSLAIDPIRAEELLEDIRTQKKSFKFRSQNKKFTQIEVDKFQVISDWYYFAVLSLADTDDFQDDPNWIAKRLGIPKVYAAKALETLERLEMLERNHKGHLVATGKQFSTTTDVNNIGLKKHHYQNLELARKALDEIDMLKRDFSFINMAVDPDMLSEIKVLIKNFRHSLSQYFESGKRKEVYKLCIQLFPQTGMEEIDMEEPGE